jgi:sugar phosphate isomerase/epimerase
VAVLLGAPVFMPGDTAPGIAEPHGSQSTDFEALAAAHVERGYAAAYAPKPAGRDAASIRAAREAFAAAGVWIAEVGCWTNLLADDPELRRANFELMEEALELADRLGATCALTTVGSFSHAGVDIHDARNFSEEAFAQTVDTARRLIDNVRPKHAKLAFEVLSWDFTDTPAGVRRLLEAVDRPELGVHVDLVNWLMVSPRRYWDQHRVLEEMIEELGPWIVAGHCKDLQMQVGWEHTIVEVPPGEGHVDVRAYLTALDSLGRDVPLLFEHLADEAAYDAAAAYVRAEAEAAGVHLPRPAGWHVP